jgi:ribose 5-phosphate isomerase B
MIIAVGADHGGYPMNRQIIAALEAAGHQVIDLGTQGGDPTDDYPDFAYAVAARVRDGEAARGLIVCGSGVGACVAANKVKGIRAGLCHDTYSAHQGVEHDNMNVLCLGARVIGIELAQELVRAFLGAKFSGEARHVRRLAKIDAIEAGHYVAEFKASE